MTPTRCAFNIRRITFFHFATALLVLAVITAPAPAQWVAEGPGPNTLGQVEGIPSGAVAGAVQVLAAHPSDPETLYAGSTSGGIWKTTNLTDTTPTWTPLTDDARSLSIGALEFDPTDNTGETLLAGTGWLSSYFFATSDRFTGLLRTTDGGATWAPITGMAGRSISGVAARGSTLVAAVDILGFFTCSDIGIFRSTDTGATWSQITSGIPPGFSGLLASDPTDSSVLYTYVVFTSTCGLGLNGIYRSADTGATWTKVSSAAMDTLIEDSDLTHIEIAVGHSGQVFAAIVPATRGRLGGVFRSPTGLAGTWTAMDLPTTFEDTAEVGIHPGRNGRFHLSLAADPTDTDIVYIGGDRQPLSFDDDGSFPNSIGAMDYTGRLFRGDAGLAPGSQWTPLTHSGTASSSAPHPDSRDMVFTSEGRLIEADNGGVYERTSPRTNAGDWFSKNGNLQIAELVSIAHDPLSDIIFGGAQNTGTSQQITPGGTSWASVVTSNPFVVFGSGGDVAVDVTSTPGMSIRYSSLEGLRGFRRRTYDASNTVQSVAAPMLNVNIGAPSTQVVTPVVIHAIDGHRLILGGASSVYESLDQGDSLVDIGPGIRASEPGRSIAYGAAGNPDIVYVAGCGGGGSCAGGGGGIFIRTSAGESLSLSLANAPDDAFRGVTIDPSDPARAVAIDSSTVRWTTNTGGSWADVTHNLAAYDTGFLRSVLYLERTDGDIVVVGADRGVYFAETAHGLTYWINLSGGLPNAPVFDLDHDPVSDQLTVGTFGRGAFSRTPSLGDFLFANGFESGNTTRWTEQVPP